MTEKEIERVRVKIDKCKKALAADKKQWGGCHHDGRGIRYTPPALFLKINDYKGGLKYVTWFDKNFPDDSCTPIFLFEWTFTLFKCGKLVEAEKKAQKTFFSNTYLFDRFLDKEPTLLDENESADWDYESIVKYFSYSSKEAEFIEFAKWVELVLQSSPFLEKANEFVLLQKQLKTEPYGENKIAMYKRVSEILSE